jgi:hypothetical protein
MDRIVPKRHGRVPTSLEDIAVGIYQNLPSDMQEGIRDTYEWGNE